MAEEQTEAEGTEGGEKKGGMMKIIIMAVVGIVLLAGGAGGVYFMMSSQVAELQEQLIAAQEEAGSGQEEDLGEPLYIEFDPPFTVNIEGESAEHFLTLSISALTYDKQTYDALNDNRPMLRNSLVIMLGDAKFEKLLSPAGKEDLRNRVKEIIVKSLDDAEKFADIDDVFFTKFLMQ